MEGPQINAPPLDYYFPPRELFRSGDASPGLAIVLNVITCLVFLAATVCLAINLPLGILLVLCGIFIFLKINKVSKARECILYLDQRNQQFISVVMKGNRVIEELYTKVVSVHEFVMQPAERGTTYFIMARLCNGTVSAIIPNVAYDQVSAEGIVQDLNGILRETSDPTVGRSEVPQPVIKDST